MKLEEMNKEQLTKYIKDNDLSVNVTDDMSEDELRTAIKTVVNADDDAKTSADDDIKDIVTFENFQGDINEISLKDAEKELEKRGARQFTKVITTVSFRDIKNYARAIINIKGRYPAPVRTDNGFALGTSSTIFSFPNMIIRGIAEVHNNISIPRIKDVMSDYTEINTILGGGFVTFWVEPVPKGVYYEHPFTKVKDMTPTMRSTVYTHVTKISLGLLGLNKITSIDAEATSFSTKLREMSKFIEGLNGNPNAEMILKNMSKMINLG